MAATPDETAAVRAFHEDLRRAHQQLARELGMDIANIPQAQPVLVALCLKVWKDARAYERTFGRNRKASGVMERTEGPWPDDEDTTPIGGDRRTPVVATDDTRPGTRRGRVRKR